MMIDRDKIIAERKAEIIKHQKEINKLLCEAKRIAKLPKAKRWQTGFARLAKIIQLGVRAQMIYTQMRIIASQPMPKKEFSTGVAIVDDRLPEIIIRK